MLFWLFLFSLSSFLIGIVRVGKEICLAPVPCLCCFFTFSFHFVTKEKTGVVHSSRNSNQIAVGCAVTKTPLPPQPAHWSELIYHQLPRSSSFRDQDPAVPVQTGYIHLAPWQVPSERYWRLLQTTAITMIPIPSSCTFCSFADSSTVVLDWNWWKGVWNWGPV